MNASNTTIDFICAGAQKAGTTWLYSRLKELPDFSLPPIKELHYFDRNRAYPTPNFLADTFLYRRLLRLGWTKKAINSLTTEIKKGNFKKFKWLQKWYFSNYNDQWYLSLFEQLDGITGDITPDYSILEESDIKKMHEIAPDTKIIFILRNPIERAWSHYRFNKFVLKHHDLRSEEIDNREIIYFINKKGQELRSNYLQTLDRYTKFYDGNQIFIGFFNAVKENPEQLLSNIVRFLGGDISHIPKYCNLKAKNNTSPKINMPKEIEDYLKEKYFYMLKELSEIYGAYFTKWYNDLFNNEQSKKVKEIQSSALTLG